MSAYKPVCQTLLPWLKANLGKHCLAPMTSVDGCALRAAVQIIELYAYESRPQILNAFGTVVLSMQESTRELAYHAIAHVMDWPDRGRVWSLAGLAAIRVQSCAFEPQARNVGGAA